MMKILIFKTLIMRNLFCIFGAICCLFFISLEINQSKDYYAPVELKKLDSNTIQEMVNEFDSCFIINFTPFYPSKHEYVKYDNWNFNISPLFEWDDSTKTGKAINHEIKKQCIKSYDALKQTYLKLNENGLNEQEFHDLYKIYLDERQKIINIIDVEKVKFDNELKKGNGVKFKENN